MSETAKRLVAREQVLAYVLCALFVGFFVAAEVLGGKLFRFTLLGFGPDDIGLGDGKEFAATAGILAFPLTFVMTDIVNEYYGRPIVRLFTWIAIAVNLLLQPVIRAAIAVPAISFTPAASRSRSVRRPASSSRACAPSRSRSGSTRGSSPGCARRPAASGCGCARRAARS
jgi:uncharacterized PurR-regulated membrane protein YhhQ (DUF165 family)